MGKQKWWQMKQMMGRTNLETTLLIQEEVHHQVLRKSNIGSVTNCFLHLNSDRYEKLSWLDFPLFYIARITLSLHYDRLFLQNVAGNDRTRAQRKIREIVNLAGPVFKSQSYRLGHQITLQEVDIGYVNDNFRLSGNNVGPNM